jgi:hypothetical protein
MKILLKEFNSRWKTKRQNPTLFCSFLDIDSIWLALNFNSFCALSPLFVFFPISPFERMNQELLTQLELFTQDTNKETLMEFCNHAGILLLETLSKEYRFPQYYYEYLTRIKQFPYIQMEEMYYEGFPVNISRSKFLKQTFAEHKAAFEESKNILSDLNIQNPNYCD